MKDPKKKTAVTVSPDVIIDFVREYIYKNHKFPQVKYIANSLELSKSKCDMIVDQLVEGHKLCVVFGGHGLPRIVVPCDMIDDILRNQSKPVWMKEYEFQEEALISKDILELQGKLVGYVQFGRLLYSTDIQLEEAIAYSLGWLGFPNVKHILIDKDNPDVIFDYDNVHALVEVEGTTKATSKDKVLQLNGWIEKELSKNDFPSDVRGFLVINAFRDIDPKDRAEALTQHAKKFLRIYSHMRYFTTLFLYKDIIKVLKGEISKEEACKNIWDGEKIQ